MKEAKVMPGKAPRKRCFALNHEQKTFVKMMRSKIIEVEVKTEKTKQSGKDDFVFQNIQRARSKIAAKNLIATSIQQDSDSITSKSDKERDDLRGVRADLSPKH